MLTHFYCPIKGQNCRESLSLKLQGKARGSGKRGRIGFFFSPPQRPGVGVVVVVAAACGFFFHPSLPPSLCRSISRIPPKLPAALVQLSTGPPGCSQKPPLHLRLRTHRAVWLSLCPMGKGGGQRERERREEARQGEDEGPSLDKKTRVDVEGG